MTEAESSFGNVKAKAVPIRATKALRERGGIALILDLGTRCV
jgi:hypothetical protein